MAGSDTTLRTVKELVSLNQAMPVLEVGSLDDSAFDSDSVP